MSYSWGDDNSVSSTAGGNSFGSARRAYSSGSSGSSRASPKRTYTKTSGGGQSRSGSAITYPLDVKLSTESTSPIVVAIDVTGSMQSWPETFFEKLPLLYGEVKRYLPDTEISFAAVGDVGFDSYPVQLCEFAKGKSLDKKITSLYPEGGGGGNEKESYELIAYEYAEHCDMPKSKNPLFFFLGDEGFYDKIPKTRVKEYLGHDIGETVSSMDIMTKLKSQFKVYALRKEYHNGESKIRGQWERALGAENVMMMEDPKRVVDCIIGVVANYAGEFGDFTKRLAKRQTKGQVNLVMSSLHHLTQNTIDAANAVSLKKLPQGKKNSKLV